LLEQHRIVAKVDEMMALCDRLEAALQAADTTRARLLEALLHEALTSRADNVIDFAEARARLRPTRSEVGSLIVHHQARRGQGGRIKLGKSLYLAEAHCGLALGGSFGRANFGPHDEWIYTFEREACHAGWFSVSERSVGNGNLRVEYMPGPALAARAEDARAGLGEQAAELERVLDLLALLTAEEAEIAATLFAAWNDLLLEGAAVSDEAIITEVRERWHISKARFTPTVLQQWLGWLREHQLIPRGQGPNTRHQAALL
jgi:type I restriction enzyme S subunit